jgi:uncharacterized protein with HEPN domain
MRLHAERARKFLATKSLGEFQADDLMQSAVVRCVEVIGEAARLVSKETRLRAPAIPWPLIVGMRHVLAHDYGVVNLDKVYDVVTRHLPSLITDLGLLIKTLETEVGWTDEGE